MSDNFAPTPGLPQPTNSGEVHWPCGCVTASRFDVFVISPCRDDCPVYLLALAESKNRGNTIVAH